MKQVKTLKNFLILFYKIVKKALKINETQAARDVPGTSREGPLKVPTSRTFKGLLGDQKKIDDLMKKVFFRCNSLCFTHLLLIFTGKTNIQKF